MPVDIALVKHTLADLATIDGYMAQGTLTAEVELRLGRPLTTQRMADTLTMCRQHGWIEKRVDDLFGDMWRITNDGRARLAEL